MYYHIKYKWREVVIILLFIICTYSKIRTFKKLQIIKRFAYLIFLKHERCRQEKKMFWTNQWKWRVSKSSPGVKRMATINLSETEPVIRGLLGRVNHRILNLATLIHYIELSNRVCMIRHSWLLPHHPTVGSWNVCLQCLLKSPVCIPPFHNNTPQKKKEKKIRSVNSRKDSNIFWGLLLDLTTKRHCDSK